MSDVINAHDLGVAGGYIIEAAMQGDIDQLKAENAKLREYVTKLEAANLDVTARLTDYIGQYDPTDAFVAEVKTENAKLRKERDTYRDLVDCMVHPSIPDQLAAENAKLRELVLVLKNCADENGDCDACPINNAKPVRHPWFGCDALRDMMCELGIEVIS